MLKMEISAMAFRGGRARRMRPVVASLFAVCLAAGLFGCVPTRQAVATAALPVAKSCPPPGVMIGKLDDPAQAFCQRAPVFNTLTVTATAYLARSAKRKRPTRGAWGDALDPDARVVAVSADLVELGLTRGARLRIEGLEGEFVVMDRMHARVKKTIDIFFGHDQKAARHWGRRSLTISWQ